MKNQEVVQKLSSEKANARETRTHLPLRLQFFAGSNDNDDDDDNNDDDDDNDDDSAQVEKDKKTFTQNQVSAMLAREKKEGRRSMLRSLGFSSFQEAKNTIAALQKLLDNNDSKKDEDVGSKSASIGDDAEKNAALERAEAAESKLACITAGVNKESIEDALAIAKLKVTDDKDLATVLTEMSQEAKYASFFDNEQGSKGTGSDPGHLNNNKDKEVGSYGARLASSIMQKKENKKSSYF